MELTAKKCVPCESNTPPLEQGTIEELHRQIPGWQLKAGHVYRQFAFKDFKEAMQFVNNVAVLAEAEGHHPDIGVHYNRVELELWTHAINGLSENDFILAAKINQL